MPLLGNDPMAAAIWPSVAPDTGVAEGGGPGAVLSPTPADDVAKGLRSPYREIRQLQAHGRLLQAMACEIATGERVGSPVVGRSTGREVNGSEADRLSRDRRKGQAHFGGGRMRFAADTSVSGRVCQG